MLYKDFIENIISSRGQWNIPDGEYFEMHHVIPKALGGAGDRVSGTFRKNSHHENCVWLYPAEHFVAHWLLAAENPDNVSIQRAFHAMMGFAMRNAASNTSRGTVADELNIDLKELYATTREAYINCLRSSNLPGTTTGTKSVYNPQTKEKRYIKEDLIPEFLANNPGFHLGSIPWDRQYLKTIRKSMARANNGMYGKHLSAAAKEKKAKAGRLKRWFTDGVDDLFLDPNAVEVPESFHPGRSKWKFSDKNPNPSTGKVNVRAKKVLEQYSGVLSESILAAHKRFNISAPMIRKSIKMDIEVRNHEGRVYLFKEVE